jgi:hypothetical protein
MPNQPFYPSREGNQLQWFINLKMKIPTYYTECDISVARQAKLQLVFDWLIWAWGDFISTRRQDGVTATAWKNALANSPSSATATPPMPTPVTPPAGTPFFGMLTWLMNEIARWKRADGYTNAIGQDLGIVGAAPIVHNGPPVFTVDVMGNNHVDLGFALYGHDAVSIQSMVQGDTDFANVGSDSSAPYSDTRPVKTAGLAEWRDYRGCWMDNDVPTLDYGPTIRALVQG